MKRDVPIVAASAATVLGALGVGVGVAQAAGSASPQVRPAEAGALDVTDPEAHTPQVCAVKGRAVEPRPVKDGPYERDPCEVRFVQVTLGESPLSGRVPPQQLVGVAPAQTRCLALALATGDDRPCRSS